MSHSKAKLTNFIKNYFIYMKVKHQSYTLVLKLEKLQKVELISFRAARILFLNYENIDIE